MQRLSYFLFWLWLLIGMSACSGGEKVIPTNAPILPPTHTATATITLTPPPTLDPSRPTADVRQPSWTPTTPPTLAPTQTLLPSLTPRPSLTPLPTIETGAIQQENGTYTVTILEADLNAALADAPHQAQINLELDQVSVKMVLDNEFLQQTTQLEVVVTPSLTEGGVVILVLQTYTSSGAAITRQQVLQALQELDPALNTALQGLMSEIFTLGSISQITHQADVLSFQATAR